MKNIHSIIFYVSIDDEKLEKNNDKKKVQVNKTKMIKR